MTLAFCFFLDEKEKYLVQSWEIRNGWVKENKEKREKEEIHKYKEWLKNLERLIEKLNFDI